MISSWPANKRFILYFLLKGQCFVPHQCRSLRLWKELQLNNEITNFGGTNDARILREDRRIAKCIRFYVQNTSISLSSMVPQSCTGSCLLQFLPQIVQTLSLTSSFHIQRFSPFVALFPFLIQNFVWLAVFPFLLSVPPICSLKDIN